MAAHTLTLSAEYELALSSLLEQWQASQPETTWTDDLVLERMITSTLDSTLRELDGNLRRLVAAGRQLPPAARTQLLNTLTGAEKARLQQLLT